MVLVLPVKMLDEHAKQHSESTHEQSKESYSNTNRSFGSLDVVLTCEGIAL